MAVSIPFRRELEFEYGRVDELSPNIRRVIANNPSPFTCTARVPTFSAEAAWP